MTPQLVSRRCAELKRKGNVLTIRSNKRSSNPPLMPWETPETFLQRSANLARQLRIPLFLHNHRPKIDADEPIDLPPVSGW